MDLKKLGALWLKESSAGNKYMSGEIEINGEKTRLVVFKNDKGGVETRPDYQIFLSEERQERQEKETEPEDAPF